MIRVISKKVLTQAIQSTLYAHNKKSAKFDFGRSAIDDKSE